MPRGVHMRGRKLPPETRSRMSAAKTGEKNPRWAGDSVGYRAAHERIDDELGKASEHDCVGCGGEASEWSYKDSSGFSTDVTDYSPRCRGCHREYDRAS